MIGNLNNRIKLQGRWVEVEAGHDYGIHTCMVIFKLPGHNLKQRWSKLIDHVAKRWLELPKSC